MCVDVCTHARMYTSMYEGMLVRACVHIAVNQYSNIYTIHTVYIYMYINAHVHVRMYLGRFCTCTDESL